MLRSVQVRVALKQSLRLEARLLDQLDICDARHAQSARVTRLARTQKLTGTALLQILLGKYKTVIRLSHGAQTLVLRGILVRGDQQTIGLIGSAPDTPAQLMELRQTETVRAF